MDSGPAPRRVPGVFVSLALSVLAWALNSSFPLLFAGWRNACCILVTVHRFLMTSVGDPKNCMTMSVYQKQTLPVQFLQFGVDTSGVIVPILRRGKNNFVKLPPTNKPVERKAKGASESR